MNPSDVRAIVGFGSFVRNVGHRVDVELLFAYSSNVPDFTPPPLDVDVRACSEEDIESHVAEGHDPLCWSIRFGTAIHEKV